MFTHKGLATKTIILKTAAFSTQQCNSCDTLYFTDHQKNKSKSSNSNDHSFPKTMTIEINKLIS